MSRFGDVVYPASFFDAPDERHCPVHNRCNAPEPHCFDGTLCDPEETFDDEPKTCSCVCIKCRANRAGTPVCDDPSEHRICRDCLREGRE